MPPEMHECKDYDVIKVDVFQLGVVLFMIHIGNAPFKLATETDNVYKYIY